MNLTETPRGPAAGRPFFVRPPLLFAMAIASGIAIHLALPMRFTSLAARWAIAATLFVAGVALFVWAIRTFTAANTPVPGSLPTTTIVSRGPYGFSRNPIYVAFVLIHLGVATAFGSWWLLLTAALAASVIAFSVVPREERYLEARFGSTYTAYKASVRRWL